MTTGSHLALCGEMHVCSRRVDVRGSWAGGRPLHRIVWRVRLASNRREVGSRRGRRRLCHGRRMTRRWSGNIAYFWTITLEIRIVAIVFTRIVNRFDGRMGAGGLGRGSQRVRGRWRGCHSIGVIHGSSRGWIWLHVSVCWIPMVVVHRVGVMWVAPWSCRVVRMMVGVGDKGRLAWRGWLRSCSDRT